MLTLCWSAPRQETAQDANKVSRKPLPSPDSKLPQFPPLCGVLGQNEQASDFIARCLSHGSAALLHGGGPWPALFSLGQGQFKARKDGYVSAPILHKDVDVKVLELIEEAGRTQMTWHDANQEARLVSVSELVGEDQELAHMRQQGDDLQPLCMQPAMETLRACYMEDPTTSSFPGIWDGMGLLRTGDL